ncbi:hypothetical protein [Chengkuizengella axinellae]|uniref:Uncharacterized protein n=1 Tax=Chengkuizengella axinellae TaxID=3064388 RepID=A0ABT9IUU1_9BACL|nr:hypothetical protein [Chengkuizengella sp. 2205SS18-9]MDP5273129.1 hypothetical protein [Chengkuizengella sp. 2205SS18-9]
MNLQDSLFNWLQMKVVYNARPDDNSALKTLEFFETILTEDHHLTNITLDLSDDEMMYLVTFTQDGEGLTKKFDREIVDQLLEEINSNPKYN